MGTMMPSAYDFGIPQLVRYTAGQRFDNHHDWFEQPQMLMDGRWFNRVASFFVFLETDGVKGGETLFPFIEGVEGKFLDGKDGKGEKGRDYRKVEGGGGVAFRPVEGNAIFWVNLFANGTGDDRTIHAGMPVLEGRKTAMNIWPRKFFDM
jgi:prolyl 4-hydroxylase